MAEEQRFKPSKRKLDKARKEGKLLKSKFLVQVAVITVVYLLLWTAIPQTWVAFKMLLEWVVTDRSADPLAALLVASRIVVRITGIVIGLGGLAALIASAAQVGIHVETAVLAPRIDRLNPVAGIKKIFSLAWREVAQLLFRGSILLAIAWIGLNSIVTRAALSFFAPNSSEVRFLGVSLGWMTGYLVLGFLALGGVDYLVRRRNFLREMSMSHQEVREERKNEEGDPFIAATRRSMHEALAMQDLIRRVRKSRVILVEKNSHTE